MEKFKPKRKYINIRLAIYPDVWSMGEDNPERISREFFDAIRDIEKDIRRHIDGIHSFKEEYDSVCIHCESDPESHYKTGEPVCCEKAIQDFKDSLLVSTKQ